MKKKLTIGVTALVVGVITLVVGVVMLIIRLTAALAVLDGEYLISADKWVLENGQCEETEECDGANVEWKFTEIGKGTLTTNDHVNDYEFKWAINDDTLLIETDWLYDLEDSYKYELDQSNGVLTLTEEDGTEYRFVAQQ